MSQHHSANPCTHEPASLSEPMHSWASITQRTHALMSQHHSANPCTHEPASLSEPMHSWASITQRNHFLISSGHQVWWCWEQSSPLTPLIYSTGIASASDVYSYSHNERQYKTKHYIFLLSWYVYMSKNIRILFQKFSMVIDSINMLQKRFRIIIVTVYSCIELMCENQY